MTTASYGLRLILILIGIIVQDGLHCKPLIEYHFAVPHVPRLRVYLLVSTHPVYSHRGLVSQGRRPAQLDVELEVYFLLIRLF